jgi:hypothetical protein
VKRIGCNDIQKTISGVTTTITEFREIRTDAGTGGDVLMEDNPVKTAT